MTEVRQVFRYQDGENRLDKFLVSCLPDLSRSRLQRLIRSGYVEIDHEVVIKSGTVLAQGQVISILIPPPEPAGIQPESIPLDIVYESDDLMIVNKPAGMVVHPGAGNWSGTLVHAALAHAPEWEGVGGEVRPGIVHRLDKDTSGLILVAKNDRTHRYLQEQFKNRLVHKEYVALVDGNPPTPIGRIEAPIGRDPVHRKKMGITSLEKGREAITEYKVMESYPNHSLIHVYPMTGRTHQIRLHLAFLECPIVGDTLYGRRKPSLPVSRQLLHAYKLCLKLPGETSERSFEAPLPQDMENIIIRLRS